MTVLTGLLILLAVVIAAGLAVLGTIASAVEIVPPWFGRGEESLNTALSPRPAPRDGSTSRRGRSPSRPPA